MSDSPPKKQLIYFEVNQQGYAVDAAELAGVATGCPFVTFPGLPDNVLGLVQWGGKVYPAIDLFNRPALNLNKSTILFSGEGLKGPFQEFAIATSGAVRVFFAETSVPPPEKAGPFATAMLIDSDGHEAFQLSLDRIAELLPKPQLGARGRGGGKIAA